MAADLPPPTPDAAPVAIEAPAPQAALPINVESHGYSYSLTGNTLLPVYVLEDILRDAPTPKDGVERLNAAYQKAGYFLINVGGRVDGTRVALVVLEGRITETDLTPALAPYFAGVTERTDITRNELIRRTAMAELYAARDGLRPKGDFAPAAAVGGTKFTVTEEALPNPKAWNAGLAFGNLGSRFSSRYTASGNAAIRPGGGIEFTGNFTQGIPGLTTDSAGSFYQGAALGMSLVTPWGLYGGSYSYTRYTIGEVTAPLYPTGTIETGGVTGTQLLFANEVSRWVLTEGLTRTSNVQTGFDGNVTITDQNYTFATLGTSYNQSFSMFGQNAAFSVGVTGIKGLSGRAGTFLPDSPGVPDPRFGLVQVNANLQVVLPQGFSTTLALSGQVAESTVPQNQQWVLGGFGNLSAWLPAVMVGDSGGLARWSAASPSWVYSGVGVNGGVFAEVGVAHLHQRPLIDPETRGLADVGLNVSAQTSWGTNLSLAYAWPVWYRNFTETGRNSLFRANLYFSLNQTF